MPRVPVVACVKGQGHGGSKNITRSDLIHISGELSSANHGIARGVESGKSLIVFIKAVREIIKEGEAIVEAETQAEIRSVKDPVNSFTNVLCNILLQVDRKFFAVIRADPRIHIIIPPDRKST